MRARPQLLRCLPLAKPPPLETPKVFGVGVPRMCVHKYCPIFAKFLMFHWDQAARAKHFSTLDFAWTRFSSERSEKVNERPSTHPNRTHPKVESGWVFWVFLLLSPRSSCFAVSYCCAKNHVYSSIQMSSSLPKCLVLMVASVMKLLRKLPCVP